MINNFYGTRIPITPGASEKAKRASCPQIELPGWWWKKYFKKYARLRVVMQDMIDYNWMHGGYEEHQRLLFQMLNMQMDQLILNSIKPININHEQTN